MQGIMLVATYAVLLAVGMAIAIGIGLATDRINAPISLLVFFGCAACAIAITWPLAVRLTRPAV